MSSLSSYSATSRDREIGAGSTCRVYCVESVPASGGLQGGGGGGGGGGGASGKWFALKQIPLLKTTAALGEEAELLKRLKHPNILPLHEAFAEEENGKLYFNIVTPLATAGSLGATHMSQRNKAHTLLSAPELHHVAEAMLSGLAYLHSQAPHPVVHRDVKPSNMFVRPHEGVVC